MIGLAANDYVYLGSPYNAHEDELLETTRYEAALHCVAWLLTRENWVYSPIVHCHHIACKFDLPRGFEYWERYNFAMLQFARALYVLDIPGWRESRGVAGERNFALREGILVRLISQGANGEYNVSKCCM